MDLVRDSKGKEKEKVSPTDMDVDVGSDSKATAEEKKKKGNKVCAMLGLSGSIGIFMLNLDDDRLLNPCLNPKGFVEIQPNLHVALSFFPHVVKDTLYLFDDYATPKARVPPRVCTIKLQEVSDMVGHKKVRSENELTRLSGCRARKSKLRTLSYRDSILVFSTEIGIHYYDDENGDVYEGPEFHNLMDFELYHPEKEGERKSDVLPQLIVCRPLVSGSNRLKLYDYDGSQFYDYDFPAFGNFSGIYYNIVSFGLNVDEGKFVIETNFGRMFSLKLDGTDEYWRLCEGGYEFVRDSHNVVLSNGICLDAYGANDSRRRWLKQQQHEQSRRDGDDANKRPKIAAPSQSHSQEEDESSQEEDESSQEDESSRRLGFPPFLREIKSSGFETGRGSESSAFDFLELNEDASCMLCTVRQAFDPIDIEYHSSSNSYFFLDVLKLNIKNLEEGFPKEEFPDIKVFEKFVEKVRSLKFMVPRETCNPTPFVPGLFYY